MAQPVQTLIQMIDQKLKSAAEEIYYQIRPNSASFLLQPMCEIVYQTLIEVYNRLEIAS